MKLLIYHPLVNKKNEVIVRITVMESKRSEYGKLVVITVNVNLKFNEGINYIIIKATRKVIVLPRVMSYVSLSKSKVLLNSFLTHNFVTFLFWMFHSRIMNSKINRLYERFLCLLCVDKPLSFEKLL